MNGICFAAIDNAPFSVCTATSSFCTQRYNQSKYVFLNMQHGRKHDHMVHVCIYFEHVEHKCIHFDACVLDGNGETKAFSTVEG